MYFLIQIPKEIMRKLHRVFPVSGNKWIFWMWKQPGTAYFQAQKIQIHCLSAQEIPHELYVSGTRKCQLNHRISVCCKHYDFYVKKLKLHLNFLFRVSTALKYPQIQISHGIHSSRQYLEQSTNNYNDIRMYC